MLFGEVDMGLGKWLERKSISGRLYFIFSLTTFLYGTLYSMVQRINPDTGLVVFTVHMPDATSQVTCCCFGGVDMDILFITSAAEHLDLAKEPHAGGLYAAKVPYKGRKESRFRLTPDG
jgi:sugar lactone lactonase YvrE